MDVRDFSSQWDPTIKLERRKKNYKSERKTKRKKEKGSYLIGVVFKAYERLFRVFPNGSVFSFCRVCASPKVPCTLRVCEVEERKGKVPEFALVVRYVYKIVVTLALQCTHEIHENESFMTISWPTNSSGVNNLSNHGCKALMCCAHGIQDTQQTGSIQ